MYTTRKIGVRFTPPALVALYEDIVQQKNRKYIMPIRNFRASSNVNFVAEDLKARHHKVLADVPVVTIEKMLRILQENLKGVELQKALEVINKEFTIADDEDLNKLGPDMIRRKKEIMDLQFNKNRVNPDDPGYVYDKQVDFSGNGSKHQSGWDAEEVDDFWNMT